MINSTAEIETEESEWTQESLLRLVATMKANIPEDHKRVKYDKTLQALKWDKVAFPPFSPKACQQKGSEVLQKMRKIRSLADLLDEAEEDLSNPENKQKRVRPAGSIYFQENHEKLRKKHPKLKTSMLFKLALKQFKDLPQTEKAYYMDKYKLEAEEYKSKRIQLRNGSQPSRKWPQSSTEDVASKPASNECDQGLKCLSTTQKYSEQHQEAFPHPRTNPTPVKATSDSEDEDLEDSSSEDEQYYVDFKENEDDDDEDEDMEEELRG